MNLVSCTFCDKKIGHLPFKCSYCGKIFCSDHRLPEYHGCTMDKPIPARQSHYTTSNQEKARTRVAPSYQLKSRNTQYKYHSRRRYEDKPAKLFTAQNLCLSFLIGFIVFFCVWGGGFTVFLYNPDIPSEIQVKSGNEIVWEISYNEQNCNNLLSRYPYYEIDATCTEKKMSVIDTIGVETAGVTQVEIVVDGFVKRENSGSWEQYVDDHSINFTYIEDADYYLFTVVSVL